MADNGDGIDTEKSEATVEEMEVQGEDDVRTLDETVSPHAEAAEEQVKAVSGDESIEDSQPASGESHAVSGPSDRPPEAEPPNETASTSGDTTEKTTYVVIEKPRGEEEAPSDQGASEEAGVITHDSPVDKRCIASAENTEVSEDVGAGTSADAIPAQVSSTEEERFREAPHDHEIDVPINKTLQPDDFEMAHSPSTKSKSKPARAKRKSNILPVDDNMKEMWKLPFEMGWGREIVFRSTTIEGKRAGDVYYFSPEGKKFRSTKEIEKFLLETRNNLPLDCFTFRKQPVFKEPFEIIRNAKGMSGKPRGFGSPSAADSPERMDHLSKLGSGKKKKGSIAKEAKSPGLKVKFTTKASFKHKANKSPVMVKHESGLRSPEGKSPKVVTVRAVKPGNVAKKHTGKRKPVAVLLNGSGKKPKMSLENSQRLCDLTCGQSAPSLHCEVCMCLFHPHCVGFTPTVGAKFVCQSCNDGEQLKDTQAASATEVSHQPRIVASKVSPGGSTLIQFSSPGATLMTSGVGASPVVRTATRQMSPGSVIKTVHVTPPKQMTNPPPPIKLNIPPTSVNPDQISGQLITLPPHVTNKLNLTKPLNLKLNGQTYNIPPKCFIATNEGVKVLLPPGSLPDNVTKGGPTAPLAMSANSNQGSQQLNMRQMVDTGASDNTPKSSTTTTTAALSSVVDLTDDNTGDKTELQQRTKTQGRTTTKGRSKFDVAKSVCHFRKLHAGFDCMIHIFQYLGIADLLRVQLVCKTWYSVASQSCLWKTLRLRNVKVTDWEAAASYMAKQRTQALDLRIMAHLNNDANRTWHQLHAVLGQLKCLRQIEFSQCPSSILHAVTEKLSNLQLCVAEFIVEQVQDLRESNAKLDLGKFSSLTELECLKLRGVQGLVLPAFSFSGGLQELGSLVKLKTLALTTLRDLPANEFQFLGALTNLETLEMGDTMSWNEETFSQLGKLTKLKHLRLEAGGSLKSESLGQALTALKELSQLELINFVISDKLADCLAELTWLKVFSVWPNKEDEVASAVNSNLLKATSSMSFLTLLEWGVMNECTSENESFIPLLPASSKDGAGDAEDVSLLTQDVSINELIKRLSAHLPDTKIRVFKVPGALIKKACPSRAVSASPPPGQTVEDGPSNDEV